MLQNTHDGVETGKTLTEYGNGNNSDHQYQSRHQQGAKKEKQKRRHPLKMPLRIDPVTNRTICRFYNYDARNGCKKHNDRNKNPNNDDGNCYAACELDHETCHVCLEKGHPAHRCNHFDDLRSEIWMQFCSLTLKNTRTEDYPTNKTVLGDPIVWIGDTVTIAVPTAKSNANNGNCSTTAMTTMVVSAPKINGFKLGEDDQLLRCRRQKKTEAAFMLKLGHGSVVVDAGAHFGDSVLSLAIHAKANNRSDLQFVAIEPCSEKCEFIRSVVAANNLLENVKVLCAALGDAIGVVTPESSAKERAKRDGSLRYEYCNSNERPVAALDVTGAALVNAKNWNDDDAQNVKNYGIDESSSIGYESNNFCRDTESEGNNTIQRIPIITLDSIFDQISPLGMLHIDVEGWESNVLRGAKKSLTTIPYHCSNSNKCNNDDESDDCFPCFVVAEAWTKKQSLRRGVPGNAEEKIIRVMEDEVNGDSDAKFRFERIDDIVDIERNLVYFRKRKGNG